MLFALTTAAALIPLLATAAPYPASLRGASIPISKRSSMTHSDGSASLEALRQHLTHVEGKIRRGLDAITKAETSHHEISTLDISKSSAARSSGSVPLTDDNNQLWQGTIAVGTPPVSYTVDFDTGSSDLFLPGPSCGTSCQGHTIYNPGASSTSKDLAKSFSLSYGDGSTVSGRQWNDTVSIAGLSVRQQTLGAASTYSTGFAKTQFQPDGLMGMGFQSISRYNAPPLFQSLVAQGTVTNPSFSFKLASSGSELYIGGANPALYTGSFTCTNVTRQAYWQVNMTSVKVGGIAATTGLSAIIDTGTTLIVGDATNVAKVYSKIPGARQAPEVGSGFYTVPCNSMPSVSLTFGGRSFPISAATFNRGTVSLGSQNCVGAIVASNVGNNGWIVGDAFLTNTYTTFDYGNKRVCFATLA